MPIRWILVQGDSEGLRLHFVDFDLGVSQCFPGAGPFLPELHPPKLAVEHPFQIQVNKMYSLKPTV